MSDQLQLPPPSDEPPASPPPRKNRNWPRRLKRLAILLLFLAVAFRIAVSFAFPIVLRRVAAYYGMDCAYDRLELSMLSGDAGLWHLTFTPKGETEPVFNSEYVRGDISTLNLLRGRLAVWRVEADGVTVLVDRNADGSIPLLKLIAPKTSSSTPALTPAATPTTQPAKPIDLSVPLRIDALRLTHIRAHIRDRSVSPPLDTTFTLDLRLSNLGSTGTPVHFAVDMDADPILDAMHVEGDGNADDKSIDATLKATVDGLRLHPLSPYLHELGIAPTANEISLKAAGRLTLRQSAANPSVLAGSLNLDGLSAIADGEEAAGLDHLTLAADAIDPRNIKLSSISIDEARINGGRTADGRIRFGGVELIGVPPTTQPAAPPAASPMTLPVISLAAFTVQHLQAGFHDDAIAPPTSLGMDVDNLNVQNIVLDPKQPDAAVKLAGDLRAGGIFAKAAFQGTAKPFAIDKTFELNLRVDGIAPTALAPYLNAIGVESRLHNASFTCGLSADVSLQPGSIAANAHLKGIKLSDPGDLLALDHMDIVGANYRLQPPLARVKDIEISGPILSIQHQTGGSISAAGFATKPRVAVASAAPSSAPPAAASSSAQPAPTLTLPAIQLDHLAWKGIDIHYADQTLDPPAATELSDAGVELSNIFVDPSTAPTTEPATPGMIHAWAKLPNLIDSFSVDGSLTPSPAAMACDLKIAGSGLTASIVAPYLKSLGVAPTLQNGSFGAEVKADLSKAGVSLDAEQIRYADGDHELAGVDAFKIGDTSLSNGLLRVGAISIDRPRITITHDADGAFELAGVELSPDIFNRSASQSASDSVPIVPAKQTTAPASPASSLINSLALGDLNIKNATLKWSDLAAKPGVDTSAVANLELKQLNLGASEGPAQLHADAHIDGSLDSASIDGSVTPSLDAPDINLNVAVQGLRAGSLASYLPPGIMLPLHDGQFHTAFEAGATKNAQGGMGAKLIVTDLDYRDKGQTNPLLKVDSFRMIATRIDPNNRIYAIDEISSSGVATSAGRLADGGIGLLGIELKQAQTTTSPTSPAPPTTQPAPAAAPAPPPTEAPETVAALMAQARQAAPSLTVNKLDLNLKRLFLKDDMRPTAAPPVISDLRFRNTAPIDWGGKDAESHPPTPFRADCTIDPVIGAVTVNAQVAPLAATPTAAIDLTAADIRGNGLTSLVPELSEYIDGSSLENGMFHAHLDSQFRINRRGGWKYDLSRGFSADLDVKDIAFRAVPGGPVLAGLDDIHSDAIHYTPSSGDLHVKTLEITNPAARLVRQKDGIHVIGLVIKLPQTKQDAASNPTSEPAAAPSTSPAEQTVAQARNASQTPEPLKKPSSEISVDQLLISNIDFIAEDQTMTPPLIIPLNALDVEVRDFTNMAQFEDKPIRFNALVNAGKVPLPKKLEGSGIGGALGDAASLMGGKHIDAAPQMENRELFAQASANGQLGLYPTAHGWIKTSVSGLELAALGGAARQEGVTLGGGVFDSQVDAKLPGDGTIRTSSKFIFTDLSLSEPPQGPIFRFLHLPAPLDVVVGALQDQEGSITVPIDVPIKSNKLAVSDLVGPAIGAFGSIVVTAVASAPLKVAGGLGDLIGFGGGNKKQAPEPPVNLPFEPGYTALNSADQAQITALALRMKKDDSLNLVIHHELGGGDLKVADERANPSLQDAQNLAEQLRQQQLNTLQQRSALAGTARAELAWGSSQAADTTLAKLRTLDQQVAQNDDALDRLYDMLRPGAQHQAARRTRGACLQYGRERLDAVKQALIAAGVTNMDRVHLANPQFAQVPGDDGGKIVVMLVPKKKG